jgi:hypothetical protein
MRRQYKYLLTFTGVAAFFLNVAAQDLDTLSSILKQDTAGQNNVSSSDNYQFKRLTGPTEIPIRKAAAHDVQKLKSDEDYWYVNQVPERKKNRSGTGPGVNQKGDKEEEHESGNIFTGRVLNVIFWVLLIAGFLTLLSWFLTTSNIRLFRNKTKAVEEEQEEETSDIFHMDFDNEIQKAIDSKHFTLAVRLMYLQTLRELSDRNLITYSNERTNGDYLFQLAGKAYYKDFFKLTRSFDYTWYGQFQLSKESFGRIRNDFLSFKQQLPR